MKRIQLTRGLSTTVDPETFLWASKNSWYALKSGCGKFYAAREIRENGKRRTVLLHREILKLGNSRLDGEHEDGNSLNNLKSNLRPATRSQNIANKIILPAIKTSKYRGVSFHKKGNFWTAQLSINNRKKHLGSFDSEKEAALAFDAAARQRSGKFARTNF